MKPAHMDTVRHSKRALRASAAPSASVLPVTHYLRTFRCIDITACEHRHEISISHESSEWRTNVFHNIEVQSRMARSLPQVTRAIAAIEPEE